MKDFTGISPEQQQVAIPVQHTGTSRQGLRKCGDPPDTLRNKIHFKHTVIKSAEGMFISLSSTDNIDLFFPVRDHHGIRHRIRQTVSFFPDRRQV
ncbi:hypothetical protein D9M69_637960 [compost metagenome]